MSHHPSYAAAQPHPLGTQDKGAPTPVRGQVQHPKDVEPNPRKLEEMKASSAHKDDPMDEGGEAEVKVRDVASEVHKPVVVYALRVLDPAGAGVMGVRGEDVAEKDVAWLRQQIQEHLNKVGPHPPDAEKRELCLYQQWGEWLEDDVKLVQIPGDTVHFTLYMPHGDSVYNLNFRCLPAHMHMRILTVPVKDDNSIIQVKTKVAAAYHIPAVDQRYLFGGRVLDDERTLGELKIPAEATIDLDILNL